MKADSLISGSGLAARLKQSASVLPSLDYIHLSGKTTFLPVVMEVFKQSFNAQIHRAGGPKECVVRGACLARAMSRRGRKRRLVLPLGQRRTTSSVGLLNEDGLFQPIIPLDCTIPDEGLVRERPNSWNSDGPLVLWENLGFEKERVRADGSINPLLQRLGTWEPAGNATVLPEFDYALRLNLHPDYTLKATLVSPENQIIPLRQRGSSSEN